MLVGRALRALSLLTALLLGACTVTPVQTFELNSRATNDANQILTVEGETDLPEGAPIEISIYEKDGRRLLHQVVKVKDGQYFGLLDVSDLAGFVHYDLVSSYDPLLAETAITRVTGHRGEAMYGEGVEFSAGRYRLVSRLDLMLVVNDRATGARYLRSGDLAGAAKELESYLARNPDDLEASLNLARVYLRWRAAERRPGTRAHTLLLRITELHPNTKQAQTARMLLGQIQRESEARDAEEALRRDLAGQGRFRRLKRVVPGKQLGAIDLGMPFKILSRRFTVKPRPRAPGQKVVTIEFEDFLGVSVGVDTTTNSVVWASSSDPHFRLDGDLGVDSLVQEFSGRLRIKTPVFGPEESDDEGNRVSYGVVSRPGIEFTIERKIDPVFRIAIDRVSEMRVIPLN